MKKVLSLVLVMVILISGLFILTGCNNETSNTRNVSAVLDKGKFTVSVPKNEEGEAKYKFTEEKPAGASTKGIFYLETDNVVISFSISGLVYNTSTRYQDKYGKVDATFDGYLTWMAEKESGISLPGMEQLEINGRKAIRYYNRTGESGQYTYDGYFYFIGVDDIYPGSYLNMNVSYKGSEKNSEAKEFDSETLSIINSLKIVLNNNN